MAEAITVPLMPRLLTDDVTAEALASLLADQGGRIALISAEGGPFDVMAGRYSNVQNLDVYLKGHAGDHLRVDRKGRPPEIVDKPALTVGVAFQPGILPKIATREGFRSRGLLARFLFSVPHSYVGRRDVGAPSLDPEIRSRYGELVKMMVLSLAEWTDPCVLTLNTHARAALLKYERALEPRLAPEGDLGSIADWGSKLAGAVLRIAGLLHLAGRPTTGVRDPIDEVEFAAAATIGDYFLAHAIAAHGLMGADPASTDTYALLEWIEQADKASFSRRDAHRDNQARFPRVTDLDPVLSLLVGHGYIRPREHEDRPAPGRPPSPVFDVNPLFTGTEMTERQNPCTGPGFGQCVISVNGSSGTEETGGRPRTLTSACDRSDLGDKSPTISRLPSLSSLQSQRVEVVEWDWDDACEDFLNEEPVGSLDAIDRPSANGGPISDHEISAVEARVQANVVDDGAWCSDEQLLTEMLGATPVETRPVESQPPSNEAVAEIGRALADEASRLPLADDPKRFTR